MLFIKIHVINVLQALDEKDQQIKILQHQLVSQIFFIYIIMSYTAWLIRRGNRRLGNRRGNRRVGNRRGEQECGGQAGRTGGGAGGGNRRVGGGRREDKAGSQR